MKATELRIGNYITGCFYSYEGDEDEEKTELCKVVGIDNVGFSEYPIWVEGLENTGNEVYNDFEPIPLTEDYLLKFGFNYIRNVNEYHNRKINEGAYYLKPVGDVYNHWYLYHKTKMITENIQHVHQLQNIYFALTGEELTINN